MKAISAAFSHLNLLRQAENELDDKYWKELISLKDILMSEPMPVKNYDELVRNVAQISYWNRHLMLYYRGQSKDFMDHEQKSTLLPSIYRSKADEAKRDIKHRFEVLNSCVKSLQASFSSHKLKIAGTHIIHKFQEVSWALLQHYEVCGTPLLDLTHSLHVASSFAYHLGEKTGVVYVLALPWMNDAIGYNSHEEIINLRLVSSCPPQAQRPFFQEGYLAGQFPNYKLDDPKRSPQFDLSRRVIAKFCFDKNPDFWGSGFMNIPEDKLYPGDDIIGEICLKIKEEMGV
jgi:hypothetical protein